MGWVALPPRLLLATASNRVGMQQRQHQHSAGWVVSSTETAVLRLFKGNSRRSNRWGILQAKSELWATNWTIVLYLTKSGFLLSVQEVLDAKSCAHSSITAIWCVWDAFNLLCKLSTDDILVHSLPDDFQTCWNYNHWGICDLAHLRDLHIACKRADLPVLGKTSEISSFPEE